MHGALDELGVVAHSCNPNTLNVEAEESRSLEPSLGTSEFWASLWYLRPCLKSKKGRKYIFYLTQFVFKSEH